MSWRDVQAIKYWTFVFFLGGGTTNQRQVNVYVQSRINIDMIKLTTRNNAKHTIKYRFGWKPSQCSYQVPGIIY